LKIVRRPQTVVTELFRYDPAAPSQLLGKWRNPSQLDSKLQPLRVGVVEDPIGKMVGRITVQEGDARLPAPATTPAAELGAAAAIEREHWGYCTAQTANDPAR
jgi:hypothetical protein